MTQQLHKRCKTFPAPRITSPRAAAWQALNLTGSSAPDAADNLHQLIESSSISDADRRLATQLLMGVLRRRHRLDHCLGQLLTRPLADQEPALLNALRLGAFQVLFLDHAPDYAIVHETVEMVKRSSHARASGLINGVLRNLLRRRDELAGPVDCEEPNKAFDIEESCPPWIQERLDAGASVGPWRPWWKGANETPALHLRINTLKSNREEVIAELKELGLSPRETPIPDVVALPPTQRPGSLLCFTEGRATIQDAAAALVDHFAGALRGERIVDFCAAPGGKTAHLAALCGNDAEIIGTDHHPGRLAMCPPVMERLGVRCARFELADATFVDAHLEWADLVLVDAPCTGMGTIRRHPEIRWHRSYNDVLRSAEIQSAILDQAARLVRPGGRLVYSTCTLFHEENQGNIDAFLSRHSCFRPVDTRERAPDFVRPFLNERGALSSLQSVECLMDGFYAAVLENVVDGTAPCVGGAL